MAWPCGSSASWRSDSGSPRREPDLLADQVDAVHLLGDRVLDLEPGVHLEEVEAAVPVEQELDCSQRLVGGRLDDRQRRLTELAPQLGRDHRRRALLDHLLVAPLDRALALADEDRVAVAVGRDLDLDVAGPVDQPLDVDPVVAEERLALRAGAVEGRGELVALADRPHALAAAAGHRLQQHRQAVLIDEGLELGEVLERLEQPRDQRHAGRPGELAGLGLRAHQPDRRRRRADPGQSGRLHRLGEAGVLGQESVAGMDEVGARAPGRVEQALDREVALRRRRRADAEGLVRHQDVRRHPVDLGVDGHRRDVHLPAGADDPDRDLAAVGDEELHRRPPPQGLGVRGWG